MKGVAIMSLQGDIIYAMAAGLGMLAWVMVLGYEMFNLTPPAAEVNKQLPEESTPYHFKKAA